MLPYFLAIPVAWRRPARLVASSMRRGAANWLISTVLMSLAFLIHLTTAMIVVPAAAAGVRRRAVRCVEPARDGTRRRAVQSGRRSSRCRIEGRRWFHLAVWMIPIVVLAVNAFWWLPGIWLASTKGESGFAFDHPEGVIARLVQIVDLGASRPFRAFCWRRACRDCS